MLNTVGVVDSYKILAGGFADMLSGAKHPDWDFMVKNGDTTQSIAELNKQMSLIDSKSGFWKVMGGVTIRPWWLSSTTPSVIRASTIAVFLAHQQLRSHLTGIEPLNPSMLRLAPRWLLR